MVGFFYAQSEYSLLDNIIPLDSLILKSKEFGYSFLALSDNSLHSSYKFYKSCIKNNIKPVMGLKAKIHLKKDTYTYFLLYAKNTDGFKNLLKISTVIENSKDKEIDYQELKNYKDNLIFITPGFEGNIEENILANNQEKALAILKEYKNNFPDFYIGLQLQNIFMESISLDIYNFSKQYNIKVLPISKTSYIEKEDKQTFEYIKKIKGDFQSIDGDYYLKSPIELEEEFTNFKDIFYNTNELINQINYIDLFPSNQSSLISLPKYKNDLNLSSKDYLNKLSISRLKKRLNTKELPSIYLERLNYELSIISKMNYEDYFLVVFDFVDYAKQNNILVGPGRGSSAGSLVSYSLGITDIDPLKYNLYFERFLNPERISMPDIDLDFPDNKREDVINYVINKYGKNHVCYITTFGTFQAKLAIRDLSKVMDIPIQKTEEVLSLLEDKKQLHEQISSSTFKKMLEDEELGLLLKTALKIEGLPKNTSTHAAGIILNSSPLDSIIPLSIGFNNSYQSQYESTDLEELGLLKIDFLGLKNLTLINDIAALIPNFNINDIPLDDKNTFDLLKKGYTNGVFQLESNGMKDVLKRLKPNDLEDLIAVIALYRPGPMDQIPEFIDRKNGKKYDYIHPILEPILESTYGVIVYQEQIMKIANSFAGYSLGEADILRRAVSKKKSDVLENERIKFIQKSLSNNHSEREANLIYDYIVKFSNYGFNRNHSVPYSLIAYQTAYLKANYSLYFMKVQLTQCIGSSSQTINYIKDCTDLGISIIPPNINKSTDKYEITSPSTLLYPLTGIKTITSIIYNKILIDREETPYSSYSNFITCFKPSPQILDALIFSSSLDLFNKTKKELTRSNFSDVIISHVNDVIKITEEFPINELQEKEIKYLGFNLKYSIENTYSDLFKKENLIPLSKIEALDLDVLKTLCYIKKIKNIKTKSNEDMAFVLLSDGQKEIDVVIFPKDYKRLINYLECDIIHKVEISKGLRDDVIQYILTNIEGI